MHQKSTLSANDEVIYPDSDGKPISDNTKQGDWIVLLYGNLCGLFSDRPDVFVAVSNLWYPVEGHPEIRIDPDVYVAFGRPKGDRGSYKQWEENGIPLTVVFEVLSPANGYVEMEDKRLFYEDHRVEEYYVYNPDTNRLLIFIRQGQDLRRILPEHGFVSPRLGIRFDFSAPEMRVFRSDGRRFTSFVELVAEVEDRQWQAEQARWEARQWADEAKRSSVGQAVPDGERVEESGTA